MAYSYERILKPDGSIDTTQLLENFKLLYEDKLNSPYLHGKGNPFTITNCKLGSVYTDTVNGKIYKRSYVSGLNNGWVELKASEERDFIVLQLNNQTINGANQLLIFTKKDGNLNLVTGTNNKIQLNPCKKYAVIITFSSNDPTNTKYYDYGIFFDDNTLINNLGALNIAPGYGSGYVSNDLVNIIKTETGAKNTIYVKITGGNFPRYIEALRSSCIIFEL